MAPKYYIEITDGPTPYYCFSYFDTEEIIAGFLFDRYQVNATVEGIYGREDDPYKFIVVRIPRAQREEFMYCLQLLPSLMDYMGYTDYEDFCRAVMQDLWHHFCARNEQGITPLQ